MYHAVCTLILGSNIVNISPPLRETFLYPEIGVQLLLGGFFFDGQSGVFHA